LEQWSTGERIDVFFFNTPTLQHSNTPSLQYSRAETLRNFLHPQNYLFIGQSSEKKKLIGGWQRRVPLARSPMSTPNVLRSESSEMYNFDLI
jgi:hypothetical protein